MTYTAEQVAAMLAVIADLRLQVDAHQQYITVLEAQLRERE